MKIDFKRFVLVGDKETSMSESEHIGHSQDVEVAVTVCDRGGCTLGTASDDSVYRVYRAVQRAIDNHLLDKQK